MVDKHKTERDERLSFTEETFGINKDPQEIRGSKEIIGTSLIGVELELEGINDEMDSYRSSYWNVTNDGSLNESGREFIFKKPFGGKSVITALNSFNRVIEERGINPIINVRTSTHIHIDTRDLSYEEYFSFILLYLIFEHTLFTYCGREREGNQFCKPLYELDTIEKLALSFQFNDGTHSGRKYGREKLALTIHNLQRNKYCAMNLGATLSFGSIEFRMHEGEYRKEKILNWINILLSMKEYIKDGVEGEDWIPLFTNISLLGVISFAQDIFGPYFPLINNRDIEEEVMQGMRLCQDILYIKSLESSVNKIFNIKEIPGDGEISKRFKLYAKKKRIKIIKMKKKEGESKKEVEVNLEGMIAGIQVRDADPAQWFINPRAGGERNGVRGRVAPIPIPIERNPLWDEVAQDDQEVQEGEERGEREEGEEREERGEREEGRDGDNHGEIF